MLIFSVTTPASNLNLLTAQELRTAIGLGSSDTSKDAELTPLGLQVSSAIARYCQVEWDGIHPPTLLQEGITETQRWINQQGQIILARQPVSSVTSLTSRCFSEDIVVDVSELAIDGPAGLVTWVHDTGFVKRLGRLKVAIVYTAGYPANAIPSDLKLAAASLTKDIFTANQKADPNLKRRTVEGVGSKEWWVSPSSDPLISGDTADLLAPFVNQQAG